MQLGASSDKVAKTFIWTTFSSGKLVEKNTWPGVMKIEKDWLDCEVWPRGGFLGLLILRREDYEHNHD